MAERKGSAEQGGGLLATVERLITAADGDTLYRDVYLRRASELLSPIVSETSWAGARTGREHLATLMAKARAAVGLKDWASLREIGGRASTLQRSLDADPQQLAVAEAVYAAPAVVLDPFSPGLSSKRWPTPAQARADVGAALEELARGDAAARELYLKRKGALEGLGLPGVAAVPAAGAAAEASPANVERLALQALERGDARTLEGLAASMLGSGATTTKTEAGAPAARGAIQVPASLGEALPADCLPRAKALGLEASETKLASPELARAVSDFIEHYALGASPAVHARAVDGVARVAVAAEGISVPREIAAIFAETVSLFALHLFVNSAGVRFVPVPVQHETLLVEAHPDGDETVTPLVGELGLDRRRGLSRDEIEAALRRHGARIIGEKLGLDPLAFCLVCIPADIFMRLGGSRGWGQRPEWTHFDGYQVMKGAQLRALVGGNSKFGGVFDFCSISRDDGRDNTLARFAVVHRERLGVRIG